MKVTVLLALFFLSTPNMCYAVDNGQYQNVDPAIRQWFKNVISPSGIPCCDVADGHPTSWRPSHVKDFEYEVLIEGNWYTVPPEAVVRDTKNPTGDSVVWYHKFSEKQFYIRCFVMGSGS